MPIALQRASARATGKLILLGEHAVVHGQPAIVAGIDRGVRVTVLPGEGAGAGPGADPRLGDAIALAARLVGAGEARFGLEVEGDLPIAMGLGSSAALAVAVVRALATSAGVELAAADIERHAHEIERVFHGTPSGVDSAAATHGGVRWFEAGPPSRHEPIVLRAPLPLLVILSRTPHATSSTVGGLRSRAAAAREVYDPVFGAIGSLVAAARRALEEGEHARLGELMSMNHGLLRACGVSTAEIDAIVDEALEAGASGAKLTGAGGGGAVIALPAGDPEALREALAARGHEAFVVRIGLPLC